MFGEIVVKQGHVCSPVLRDLWLMDFRWFDRAGAYQDVQPVELMKNRRD